MSKLALVEDRAVSTRNEEQLVTMTVDGQLFGLPILSVQDIVETHKITQVPRTPSAISGIMNLRGRIVTVINLRRILGRSDDSNSRMGVTVEFKGDLYTILVDEIGEVRLLNKTDFEAAPATLNSKLKLLCTGIYRLDGELLAVLDVHQILSPETIAQTPPIQFIARRQRETVNPPSAPQRSLPAPAEEEVAAEVSEAGAPPAKHSRNIFRKVRAAAAAGAAPAAEAKAVQKTASAKRATAPSSKGTSAKSSPPAKSIETGRTNAAAPEHPPVEADAGHGSTPSSPAAPRIDLLELIGGDAALTAVVHGFYERIAADKTLARRFGSIDVPRQAKAMRSFLAAALRGNANGRAVTAPGHQWLSLRKGLNDDDFNKCLGHFEAVLHSRALPEGTISRILAIFERSRESVVD